MIPRAFRLSACLALALVAFAGSAHADATSDVADLRAGALPARHEAMGWSASDALVVRTLVCVEGGTTACTASLRTESPAGTLAETKLLEVVELYCSKAAFCAPLSRPVVARFVDAEKRANAKLPPLLPATATADPESAMGTVAGAPTHLEFRQTARHDENRGDLVRLELVARGARNAIEPLAVLETGVQRIERAPQIVAAYPSPDGSAVAFVVSYATGMMCWGPLASLEVRVVALAPRRASLANSIGFRAYKAGQLAEALAAFSASTREDPRFGLAWFNRAAVEARLGMASEAKSSLARATDLDGTFAARACADADFASLAAELGCRERARPSPAARSR